MNNNLIHFQSNELYDMSARGPVGEIYIQKSAIAEAMPYGPKVIILVTGQVYKLNHATAISRVLRWVEGKDE